MWEKARQGKLEEIPADIRVKHYCQLKRIEKDALIVPNREKPKECLWLYGPPRVGKSRDARSHEDVYIKLANKWWDGYTGQKVVVLDDLGREKGKALTDHIKLWADPWYN